MGNSDVDLEIISDEVIALVSWLLGRPGEPHDIVETPSYEHNWQPHVRATGCYRWLFEVVNRTEMDRSESEPLWRLLAHTRTLLETAFKGESVFAYISNKRTWNELGQGEIPCIVVAPTSDPYDAIRIEQTADGNCDLGPVEWIQELQFLDERYGLDMIAVTHRYVEVQFGHVAAGTALKALKKKLFDTFSTSPIYSDYLEMTMEDLSFPVVLACDD